MNIVILGAGTVGRSVAELLASHGHDVRLIDPSPEALQQMGGELDIQFLTGNGCDVTTLFQADILSADLCLAVTSHDEINLVGASLAKAMGAKRAVARVFEQSYRDCSTFDYRRHFRIDRLVSLEQLTALELAKSIRRTDLFTVETFAQGGIEVQEVEVQNDAKALGKSLRDLELPFNVRIALIGDDSQANLPVADDVIEAGQHLTLIGETDAVAKAQRLFDKTVHHKLDVMIVGGGEIGFNLAKILEKDLCQVTLMEADAKRAEFLSSRLMHTTVLHADATRRGDLEEARVGKSDVFIATMGRDEDNILCGVEAQELGAKRRLCIVRRPDYTNVVQKVGIDLAISPREVLSREVLGMVTGTAVLSATSIAREAASVWEIEVPADAPVTMAPLNELRLMRILVAAIVRDDFVSVPKADARLKPGDLAVVLMQKGSEERVRELFKIE